MKRLLITNGLIYDGTGKEPFIGSIYIENDLIKKVWRDAWVDLPPSPR